MKRDRGGEGPVCGLVRTNNRTTSMISHTLFEVHITTQPDCDILIIHCGPWVHTAGRECVRVQGCACVCEGGLGVTTLGEWRAWAWASRSGRLGVGLTSGSWKGGVGLGPPGAGDEARASFYLVAEEEAWDWPFLKPWGRRWLDFSWSGREAWACPPSRAGRGA